MKKKYRPFNYFFLDGELHRSLHKNRAQDMLTAWNYPQGKVVNYIYSEARKKAGKAFTTNEVAKMIRRHRVWLENIILRGDIPPPPLTYSIENKNPHKYMWSEQDVLRLHDYLATVHRGRPRNDGRITNNNLPSRKELIAMMKHDTVFYVKTESGEFIPTWQAPEL